MNALKHGLRAREFGLLPEESPAEWAVHLAEVRAGLGPVERYEEKLATGLAVAMWQEIRADRVECDVMAEIPPGRHRGHGGDLQEPAPRRLARHRDPLPAPRAGMAAQRAQRTFLAHRKARKDGLVPTMRDAVGRSRPARPSRIGRVRSPGDGGSKNLHERIPPPARAEPGAGEPGSPRPRVAAAPTRPATRLAATRPGRRDLAGRCRWSRPIPSARPSRRALLLQVEPAIAAPRRSATRR